jgi:hypothetical protein
VAKTVIPRDLAISPGAFAATLDAMHAAEIVKAAQRDEMQACTDLRFLNVSAG